MRKTGLHGLHFCHWQYGSIAAVNLTQLDLKAAVLCEITRNDGHWAFKVTQRRRIGTEQYPGCDFLLVYLNLSYLAWFPSYHSVLVQIITFDKGCLYLTPSFRVNPWILGCKMWPQQDHSRPVVSWCIIYFDTMNRFGVNHQRDRQTKLQVW